MSAVETKAEDQVAVRDEQPESRRAVGAARLLPTVSFGLRAAVLTGVVVVTGTATTPARTAAAAPPAATTVLLSAALGSNNVMTTCCPKSI